MFLNAEELLNAPDDEEERREKARRKRIRQVCIVLAAILLAVIVWQKWPVQVPAYAKGETAQVVYTEIYSSGDPLLDSRVTNEKPQIQQLENILKDYMLYKKLIQPLGVRSNNKSSLKEIKVFLNSEDGSFILSMYIFEDGTITINNQEYTVGLFGDKGKSLYQQLYEFYKSTLNNDKWSSGNK